MRKIEPTIGERYNQFTITAIIPELRHGHQMVLVTCGECNRPKKIEYFKLRLDHAGAKVCKGCTRIRSIANAKAKDAERKAITGPRMAARRIKVEAKRQERQDMIKAMVAQGIRKKEIAAILGVSSSLVSHSLAGKR